ncbi:MAG TPA: GIY-YIG nuclease family protein [Terriglobales bacterium]|nr:GIY-YIG nuclease family protein [Terriglobales bacterium]
MNDHQSYSVYMVTSKSRVIYIGMTNNLERRFTNTRTAWSMVSARASAAIAWSIKSRSTKYSKPSIARSS